MAYQAEEARELILKTCRELVDRRLILRTWGNISARVEGGLMAITPSGMAYEDLTVDDIVLVDLEKGKYEGDIRPSSEKGVHLECYKQRPDVNFVIHTHQTYASALSVIGRDIRLGSRVSLRTRELIGYSIVCAQYGRNGTSRLRKAVGAAIEANPGANHVLMKNHGALCLGTDHDNALHIAVTLEKLSEKIYDYYCTDGAPLVEKLKQRKALKEAQANGTTGSPDLGVSKDADLAVSKDADACATKGTDVCAADQQISVVQSVAEGADPAETGFGTWILHAKTPYIMKISGKDETLKAYLDDLAQIAGPSIRCISADADKDILYKALGSNNAVLVEGDGAYCFGPTYDEALCVAEVLEKGCVAALLAGIRGIDPIGMADAMIDRYKYVKKYSKLKDCKCSCDEENDDEKDCGRCVCR